MKVPKAGRPLAKCPHPKGSCSCQRVYALMVRIPRGMKSLVVEIGEALGTHSPSGSSCVCRPVLQVPSDSAEATSTPTSSGTSSMTTPSSPAPGRVQKYSRPQSNLQAAPESIAKAMGWELQRTGNDIFTSHPLSYVDLKPKSDPTSGVSTPNQNPTVFPFKRLSNAEDTPTRSSGSSCCSQKSQPLTSAVPQRSCCEPAVNDRIQMPSRENAASTPWNETSYPTSQMPLWDQQHQSNEYFPRGNTLGNSSLQNPDHSNQMLPPSSMLVHGSDSSEPGFNNQSFSHLSTDQLFSNDLSGYPFSIPSTFGGDSSRECSCGEDCQCLGCASHPFNSTTRQHVQEMGYMMSINEDDENSHSHPFMKPTSPPLYATPTLSHTRPPYQATQSFTENTTPTSNLDGVLPSTASYTSQDLMQPSEYYTLTYPVGLPNLCSNVNGTCQCGSDCSCVGCLTHSGHNGVALEHTPAENEQTYHAPISYGSHQHFGDTDVPRTLDEFSPSALSPPVIETPLV